MLQKIVTCTGEGILKRIVDSLQILKNNSFYLELTAVYGILVFDIISRNFKHYVGPAVNRQPGFRRGAVEQSALNDTHTLNDSSVRPQTGLFFFIG